MDNVIDILEALESDNSRLFKEELLRKHSGNDLLRRVFVAASDPYANYFVKKWKTPPALKKRVASDDKQVTAFLDVLLDDLSSRRIVGNEAKAAVEAAFSLMDERQQKWCGRILLRNLRVGVLETTVNKVWPGAIAKFSVALAETLGSRHEQGKGIVITEEVKYPVRVEPKLDGLRCIAVKHDGVVTMFTRSGSEIETLPTVKAALEAAPWDDFVLDGEAMGADWNESASVVMSHKTAKDDSNIVFNVFDAVPFDDWHAQDSHEQLRDRIEDVRDIVGRVGSKHVVQVVGAIVKDESELMEFYSKTMEKGYEGIMLKDLTAVYTFKRTSVVLKLKPVATTELVIVGHYEGNRGSKREGLWGGFSALGTNGVITKVGGGYSDKTRAEIQLAGPDTYIGKVIECEYQPDPMTVDGLTVDGKLRFPVFCRFRDGRDVDSKIFEAYERYRASR